MTNINKIKNIVATLILCASTSVMAQSNTNLSTPFHHNSAIKKAFFDEKSKEYCNSKNESILKNAIESDLYPSKGRLLLKLNVTNDHSDIKVLVKSNDLNFKKYCPAKATLHYVEIFKKNNPTHSLEKGFLIYDDVAYPIKNITKLSNKPHKLKHLHTDNFSVYDVYVSIKDIESIIVFKFDHELKATRFIEELKTEILKF